VLRPDGSLDRRALGSLVFGDAAARLKLNAITHPRIAALTRERAEALAQAGEPLAAYEAALLVENGVADAFRPLVVCACPEDVQIARLRARDGSTLEEALTRVRAQLPLAEKIAVADQVIDTGGSLADTAERTRVVLERLCRSLGVDPARYSTSP
jgi:dephospho-CoA kinase